jgi:hemolysin III
MKINHSNSDWKHPSTLYTLGEEIANSITGGIGTGLSIAGLTALIFLAVLHNSPWHLAGFIIYGITLVLLYLGSTLYHSIQHKNAKVVFQKLDHSAIYLLIAGTYTPFLLVELRTTWGWTLLFLVWGIAILGVAYKMLFIHRYERLSVLGYVFMGWLCLVAGRELFSNIPGESMMWLALGGMLYTLGITFLALKKLPYNHTVWHFFVLAASACHYFAVLKLVPGL